VVRDLDPKSICGVVGAISWDSRWKHPATEAVLGASTKGGLEKK